MNRQARYHAGRNAELSVAELYRRRGAVVAAERWRGRCGEIDLIVRDGEDVVFVEVKQSRSHAQAAAHLSDRQIGRIFAAANEFLAGEPSGDLTPSRFDVALVNGVGEIDLLENALCI